MRILFRIPILALATLLSGVIPALEAQQPQTGAADRANGRVWLEGYVTRLRLDATGMEGFGARVLRPVSRRLAVGGFVSHAPTPVRDGHTVHMGTQADLFPLVRPI